MEITKSKDNNKKIKKQSFEVPDGKIITVEVMIAFHIQIQVRTALTSNYMMELVHWQLPLRQ